MPRRSRVEAVKYLYRKVRKIIRPEEKTLIFISEKALLVLTGGVYDESKIKLTAIDKFMTRLLFYMPWCYLFRNVLPRRIAEVCHVPLEDLARHKHYVSARCFPDVLSMLKPCSECGIDVSYLPYTYVLDVKQDYRPVINMLYNMLRRSKCRIIGIAVVDSDFALVFKKLNLVLTSRRCYIRGYVNLGVLTYIIGRLRTRRLFLKTPTVTYYVGATVNTRRLFLLARRVHRYMLNVYGMTILENVITLEARDYKSITWTDLSKTVNYPLVTVVFK